MNELISRKKGNKEKHSKTDFLRDFYELISMLTEYIMKASKYL